MYFRLFDIDDRRPLSMLDIPKNEETKWRSRNCFPHYLENGSLNF